MTMRSLSLAALVVTFLTLAACATKSGTPAFAGKWKVVDFEANLTDVSPAIIEAGREEALSTIYAMRDDGTLTLTSNYADEGMEGTWYYEEEFKELTLKYYLRTDQGPEVYYVNKSTDTKAIWTVHMSNGDEIKMTLEKQD